MFTSLHHLIDGEWMREAYRRTRKDGATGIDGVTAADYEKDLEANLDDLQDRMKSGRYFAPPVRRHYIPKADGTKRPLGIPTFEDKVAQRAILMLLEPIYEADFLPCSYGFRPKRSAHDALNVLRAGIIEQRQRWVIDADLKSYFDSISHTHLRSYRRGLQGIGLDPCRRHPGARALRPGQAVRQAEKGCLAPAPATRLETQPQSLKSAGADRNARADSTA